MLHWSRSSRWPGAPARNTRARASRRRLTSSPHSPTSPAGTSARGHISTSSWRCSRGTGRTMRRLRASFARRSSTILNRPICARSTPMSCCDRGNRRTPSASWRTRSTATRRTRPRTCSPRRSRSLAGGATTHGRSCARRSRPRGTTPNRIATWSAWKSPPVICARRPRRPRSSAAWPMSLPPAGIPGRLTRGMKRCA